MVGVINDTEFLTHQFEKLGMAIHKIVDRVEQLESETGGKKNKVHTPLPHPEWINRQRASEMNQPVPGNFATAEPMHGLQLARKGSLTREIVCISPTAENENPSPEMMWREVHQAGTGIVRIEHGVQASIA